jgi:hypothetical protein
LGRKAGTIIGTFLTIGILAAIIIGVVVGIMIGLGTAVPAAAVLLGLLLIIGALILLPPLIWRLSSLYIPALQEDFGVFEAYSKTGYIMKDNFWWTWVIVFCASLAVGCIAMVFAIPQAIYQVVLTWTAASGGDVDASVPFIIVCTVCTFFGTLVKSISHIIYAFHYYSLAEKYDGQGMIERINEIGNTPKNDVEQQF